MTINSIIFIIGLLACVWLGWIILKGFFANLGKIIVVAILIVVAAVVYQSFVRDVRVTPRKAKSVAASAYHGTANGLGSISDLAQSVIK